MGTRGLQMVGRWIPAHQALVMGQPWKATSYKLCTAAPRPQHSASAVSGSPVMSLCTSLKVSMNSCIQSCRSTPVANLARSAV